MGWESRGKRRYYYQPVRADGRPRRIYRGAGDVGRVHELLTAHERRERAVKREAARAHAAAVAELRKLTTRVRWWAGQLVRAARLLGGGYQHKGQWRRRGNRYTNTRGMNTMATANPTGPAGQSDPAEIGRLLFGLNERANGGDRSALAELDDLLDRHPIVWQKYTELAADTSAGWAQLLGHGQPVEIACLRRHLTAWTAELAGCDAQPSVLAAVEAAKVAWLAVRYAEAELLAAPVAKRPAALGRLTAANRQLLDAIKLVATAKTVSATRTEKATGEAQGRIAPRLFGGAG